MSLVREGRCLCGAVTVTLPADRTGVGTCHCQTCRRWCSGPWMAIQAPEATICGDTIKIYRSSAYAERGYCGSCGSHIYHRPRQGPELAVAAGLFDDHGLALTHEIFHDHKPAFYRFAEPTAKRGSLSMALEWLPRILWRRLTGRGVR